MMVRSMDKSKASDVEITPAPEMIEAGKATGGLLWVKSGLFETVT